MKAPAKFFKPPKMTEDVKQTLQLDSDRNYNLLHGDVNNRFYVDLEPTPAIRNQFISLYGYTPEQFENFTDNMYTRFNDEISNMNAVVIWHPILEQIMNVDIPSNLTENTSEFISTDGITNDSHMLSTPFSE